MRKFTEKLSRLISFMLIGAILINSGNISTVFAAENSTAPSIINDTPIDITNDLEEIDTENRYLIIILQMKILQMKVVRSVEIQLTQKYQLV